MIERNTSHTGVAADGVMHVGIVHGVRRIHFVAAGENRALLMERLAEYVRRQAGLQLFSDDAGVVAELLKEGNAEAAVRFYFERVGERWDQEWLDEGTVPVLAANPVAP